MNQSALFLAFVKELKEEIVVFCLNVLAVYLDKELMNYQGVDGYAGHENYLKVNYAAFLDLTRNQQ